MLMQTWSHPSQQPRRTGYLARVQYLQQSGMHRIIPFQTSSHRRATSWYVVRAVAASLTTAKTVQSIEHSTVCHPLGTHLILLLVPRFPCLSGQLALPPRVCSCPPKNRRGRRASTVWRRITPKLTRAQCTQFVRSSRTSGKRKTWSGSVPWRKCQRRVPFEGAKPAVRRRHVPTVRRRSMPTVRRRNTLCRRRAAAVRGRRQASPSLASERACQILHPPDVHMGSESRLDHLCRGV